MMKKNLIITSGNGDYFEDLKRLTESLLNVGEYKGRIVVCDNLILGRWNNPGSYVDGPGFSTDQYNYFEGKGVEVVRFSDLVDRNGIKREDIESIKSGTQRYPFKFIYNCLISKEYSKNTRKVCYLDSDMIVQRPISLLFDQIGNKGIYMTPEHKAIGDSATMKEWIMKTDVSFGGYSKDLESAINREMNMCTGFIGGEVSQFNKFMQMCWAMASSNLLSFHTDQPLVNFMKYYYGFPISSLSRNTVLHMKGSPPAKIRFEQGNVYYEGFPPVVVHFNGTSEREMIENSNIYSRKNNTISIRCQAMKHKIADAAKFFINKLGA